MSRRKVRGLTRTGRQVSEDPDIDNLLSNLSPEDLEELKREVMTVPDPDPGEVILVDQTDGPAGVNNRGSSISKKPLQRDLSAEGETRKESRKQEYLRKMGLSQERRLSRSESKDGGIQVPDGVTTREDEAQDRNSKDADGKDDRAGPACRDGKRDGRESGSSKTKELISKLQEKKEDSREKERKEESRRREDSKTKGLISKLQEKRDKDESKERERKEEIRKRDDNKTRGLVSKLEEKQIPSAESKSDDKKKSEVKDNADIPNELPKEEEEDQKDREKDVKLKEGKMNENESSSVRDMEKSEKAKNETLKQTSGNTEEIGNCMAIKTPKAKTKEEEEEEESASMFSETLEKVRSNDPSMTELIVNNSEVIKIKTLIQFAEALRDNTHVKAFALANCHADDHVAYAIAGTLRNNKTITSINLDSNHLTSKGITSLIQALQHNATLTELRFHNQRHICGGKTEMEMVKVLKENTTLLKLGYHFELAGPRMTMTNLLSRNMDRQRQKRLQEQKLAQAQGNSDKKDSLEVPKAGAGFRSPKASPKPSPKPSPLPSPQPSPMASPRLGKKKEGGPGGPPPPPPPPPPAPMLDGDFLKNSLTPMSQRKVEDRSGGRAGATNSRDQLLASIRSSNIKQLKKVAVPKLLQ